MLMNPHNWYLLGLLLPQVLGIPHRSYGERRVDTQAHRGGAGMRTEESLYVSFVNNLNWRMTNRLLIGFRIRHGIVPDISWH